MRSEWLCVVDAGNSRIKVGWFRAGVLEETEVLEHAQWADYAPKHLAKAAIVASVSMEEEVLAAPFRAAEHTQLRLWQPTDPLPFDSVYTSLHTLGSDRKMLITGANKLYPGINRLVIGLGTCITYDLIDASNCHRGGDISPGMHMRWQAMHNFTARLPLVEMPVNWPALGTDTISALQAGVLQGVLAEMKGRKAQLDLIYNDLTIILSGGDAHFFEMRFDNRIFAEPNLALYGLHALL
jgi:type III pantothenate kinase